MLSQNEVPIIKIKSLFLTKTIINSYLHVYCNFKFAIFVTTLSADLLIFAEEILNGKLHFLCCECKMLDATIQYYFIIIINTFIIISIFIVIIITIVTIIICNIIIIIIISQNLTLIVPLIIRFTERIQKSDVASFVNDIPGKQ